MLGRELREESGVELDAPLKVSREESGVEADELLTARLEISVSGGMKVRGVPSGELALDSPHVRLGVKLFGVASSDQSMGLALEYLEAGESLSSLVRS